MPKFGGKQHQTPPKHASNPGLVTSPAHQYFCTGVREAPAGPGGNARSTHVAMAGGVTSAEKVTELRAFAAPGTNDARLRAALVRAGGNLNHAAEILLAEPDAFPDRPTLAVPPRPGASNAQCVTPGAPVAPGASVEVIQAPVLSDSALRKMAWRAFYKKSYRTAVAAVGLDNKECINEYIANAWKELGSARREQLAHSVRRAAEAPASSEQPPAVSIAPVRSESVRIVAPVPAATSVVPPLAPTPITVKRPRPVSVNDTIDVDAADILPDVAQSTSKKPCLEHRTPAPQADVVELVEDTFLPSSEKDGRIPAWPKELVSRLCRGSMQVNGRNLLKAGDVVLLEVPPPRKPKPAASGRGRGRGRGRGGSVSVPRPLPANNKVVRFSRKGRELGRLCPEIGRVLGPALQSGYLVAECRVVSVPLNIRMFSEIILDVTLRIRKEAFVDDEVQRALVASGTNAASSTGPSSSAANKQDGVDTKRIGIVELITSLGVCTPEKKAVSDVMPGFTKPTGADPTEVTAEAAEAYYNTVEAINKDDIADFVVPRDLRCDLREYQMAGVAWMVGREKHGSSRRRASDAMLDPLWRRMVFPDQTPFFINATTGALCLEAPGANGRGDHGGILADEMGLGKTIQTIALIVHDLNSCADEAKQSSEDKALAVKISAASVKGTDGDEIVRGLETDGKDYKDENAEYDGDVEENDDVTREDHMNDVDVPESVSALHTRAKSTVRSSRRRPLSRRNAAQKDKHVVNVDVCEILSDSDASAGKEETGDSDSEWFEKPQVRRAKPGPKSRSVLKELKRLGKLKGGTLIVCPMSLVEQWMSELHLHTAPNSVRVSSHYGHGRGDSASISTHCADVVVTTYGILASEAPIAEADDKPGKPGGPLFQVPWRRAVLDEAHYVKSRTTKWARAAFQLRAERRWW